MSVNVDPAVLKQAADGINGVIDGLSGAPVVGSYTGQTGRGFDDLALTGQQMSKPQAKSAMDNFCERWEWGIRAIVQSANDISHKLHLGAGMYEKQDDFNRDMLKDIANDLVGDPSLQQESVRDADGNIVVRGTDDMSASDLLDYNKDRLAHPDIDENTFGDMVDAAKPNLEQAVNELPQAGMNMVPGGAAVGAANAIAGD
ncbi:hypothetical protein [Williamsia sp. Leaf354]|uniref:hypothetical protein n=1 Tax=Williamsia sp. Leaf354 TaxID=1736349 RepID=UPI000A3FCC24|nr:hypothetical protein [Williamsia sp. Leaf354]